MIYFCAIDMYFANMFFDFGGLVMKNTFKSVDKIIFFFASGTTLSLALFCIVFPTPASTFFNGIFNFFTLELGFTYIYFLVFVIAVILFLGFSKFGKIRLGKDTDIPEYSLLSWFSMIFAAGMGIGLVFWSVAEPMNHFLSPPFSDSLTGAAAQESLQYTFLHWGIHPWALYVAVALPLAYFHFRKGLPLLISSTFYPFFKEKALKGWFARSIDTFTIVLILIGVATSFGLGAIQIQSGLHRVYDVPESLTTSILIVLVCTGLFILSSTAGIDRGMKLMSNTNTIIVFGAMLFVLCLGPTQYIFGVTFDAIGSYLGKFIPMSFFTDANGIVAENTGFNWIGSWTVFYWAWWITWTPFVGSFIAKISKGRTIREFVLAILGVPTLMSFIWFGIMGGSGMKMEMNNPGNILIDGVINTNSAIFDMLSNLPFPGIISTLVMLSLLVFFLTSADAGVQVMSTMSSKGVDNPNKLLKVIWGLLLGLLAIMFIVTGGLSTVQSLSFAFSFPYLVIIIFMLIGLIKYLSSNEL